VESRFSAARSRAASASRRVALTPLGMLGIDSGQVEIHLESTLMCPYRLSDRPAGVPQALDRVGNDRAADALQINRGRRMRRYDVAHERVGLVADVSGSTIDSRRAERLACAPIIVYSIRFTLPKLPTLP